ncbi:DUF2510 domain-containing protein [Nocardia sp. R7R-8]|uniref:DUF2510 domain-containing protein n=1 Tax=Nocardia sp. R7R-8 TaxID=3459304 RepID=UPI00403E134B
MMIIGVDLASGGLVLFLLVAAVVAAIVVAVGALIQHHGTPPAAPPAGWYPDSAGMMRWFDGSRWTEFTQPPPGSGSPGSSE